MIWKGQAPKVIRNEVEARRLFFQRSAAQTIYASNGDRSSHAPQSLGLPARRSSPVELASIEAVMIVSPVVGSVVTT